ncbi:hypothetical protein S7711_09952 [Stachybotrys chartarum IBT 7711]|uniref:Uncharacterized protein n=1 Tax=Stachybotrys chartarum (strain CBS 109288 / IBT 7711) TaxID=1280523 RepID=A0A084ALD1_STACB|nr:hypothetical protein S7711_09952 [Stachybotrys chartarum IBT 7711]
MLTIGSAPDSIDSAISMASRGQGTFMGLMAALEMHRDDGRRNSSSSLQTSQQSCLKMERSIARIGDTIRAAVSPTPPPLSPLDRHIVSLLPPLHPHLADTSTQINETLQLQVVGGDSVGPGGRPCYVEIAFRQEFSPQHLDVQIPRSNSPEQLFWMQYLGGGVAKLGGTEAVLAILHRKRRRVFVPTEAALPRAHLIASFTTPERVISLLVSRHGTPNFVKCQGCVDVFSSNSDEHTHVLGPFHDCISLDAAADARCSNCIWYGNACCAPRKDPPPLDDKIDFLQDAPIIFPVPFQYCACIPPSCLCPCLLTRLPCRVMLADQPREHVLTTISRLIEPTPRTEGSNMLKHQAITHLPSPGGERLVATSMPFELALQNIIITSVGTQSPPPAYHQALCPGHPSQSPSAGEQARDDSRALDGRATIVSRFWTAASQITSIPRVRFSADPAIRATHRRISPRSASRRRSQPNNSTTAAPPGPTSITSAPATSVSAPLASVDKLEVWLNRMLRCTHMPDAYFIGDVTTDDRARGCTTPLARPK